MSASLRVRRGSIERTLHHRVVAGRAVVAVPRKLLFGRPRPRACLWYTHSWTVRTRGGMFASSTPKASNAYSLGSVGNIIISFGREQSKQRLIDRLHVYSIQANFQSIMCTCADHQGDTCNAPLLPASSAPRALAVHRTVFCEKKTFTTTQTSRVRSCPNHDRPCCSESRPPQRLPRSNGDTSDPARPSPAQCPSPARQTN